MNAAAHAIGESIHIAATTMPIVCTYTETTLMPLRMFGIRRSFSLYDDVGRPSP
jgi:hypothetical protein